MFKRKFYMFRVYLRETIKYILRSEFFLRKELKLLRELDTFSAEKLKKKHESQFLFIVKYAYENSKFYKNWYDSNDVDISNINSIEDIYKLPVLTRKLILENIEDIPTKNTLSLLKARTSGTTGSPLTVMYSYEVVKFEHAQNYLNRHKCGFTYGQKLASFRGNLDNTITDLFIHVSNTLYLSSFNIREELTTHYWNKLLNFGPRAIEGYPSSLYSLCVLLDKKNLSLSIPICFTSSETLLGFQRELIERVLNTKIYDHYGNSERTVSLSQLPNTIGYKVNKLYSEIEWHEKYLLTTSLINKSFPMIRYKVDDIVEVEKTDDTLHVKSIDGRIEDVLTLKDGTKLGRLDHIFKTVKNIEFSQLIQRESGSIDVNYVPNKFFNDSDKLTLISQVDKFIGLNNANIRINKVSLEELIMSSSGKFRFVISNYKDRNGS